MRNRSIAALIAVVLAGSLIAVALVRRGDAETDALRASPEASVPAEVVARYQSTAAQRQGRVVRVDYTAGSGAATIGKHALVYLPAGYDTQDQQRRYDILYLMHGAGMNADSFLRGSDEPSTFKNLLDHMIEDERMRPTIVVTPSFYPDGDASLDLHYAGQLDRVFPRELEDDLMPAVESRYRTFARTADAAGFIASRTHRAFGGFSMGAVTTWYVLIDSLDYFAFFMPMAGDCWVIEDSGGSGAPRVIACSGSCWSRP
jgi:enterochelin esterase-like enzyme